MVLQLRGVSRAATALLLGTVLAGSLGLASCSSWDSQEGSESGAALRDEVAAAGEQPDPRSLTGVSSVAELGDTEPVTQDAQPELPVSLTDDDGNDVEISDVSRILALDLYGTYTKTLAGLGLLDNIVGRTVSSTEPAVADRPVVTQDGHSLNVEAILELQPTLVIVDHSVGPREAIDQIRDAGVATVVMPPDRSLETMGENIERVAQVVGLPEEGKKLARRSQDDLDASLETIRQMAPEDPLRAVFVYARGTGGVFFILGPKYGSADLIRNLGAVDVAEEHKIGEMVPANAESLADLDPEVLIMMSAGLESTGGIEGLLQRPGVAQTTAGQHQRVVTVPDGDVLSFGPQTGEMLLRTAIALYNPDLAADE